MDRAQELNLIIRGLQNNLISKISQLNQFQINEVQLSIVNDINSTTISLSNAYDELNKINR